MRKFCCNVIIYFDEPNKPQRVLRFAKQTKIGTYLYIGHSERVPGEVSKLLQPAGATV
jgi:chemotaxis protein methyltransferase CheR